VKHGEGLVESGVVLKNHLGEGKGAVKSLMSILSVFLLPVRQLDKTSNSITFPLAMNPQRQGRSNSDPPTSVARVTRDGNIVGIACS
jgi:hypothetical protein